MKLFTQITAILLVTVLMFTGCGQKADDTPAVDENYLGLMTDTKVELTGAEVSVAGVTFQAPGSWNDLGASGMRSASYTYGPLEGDTDSATVAVFFFGTNQGGTIEANLDRWIMQMRQADGSDPHTVSAMSQIDVNGKATHLLKVPGIYTASGGMMSAGEDKDGYVLIGVVLVAPEGNIFFKLTGPEKTAYDMASGLIQMVKAVK